MPHPHRCSQVLKTDDIKRAARHWLGALYGFLSILLITPCLGFALRELPLSPPEFAVGACRQLVTAPSFGDHAAPDAFLQTPALAVPGPCVCI